MEVTLKLYGPLKRYIKGNEQNNNHQLKVDDSKTIKQILLENNIPIKEVGFVLRGNQTANLDCQVQNGDVIKVFSAIAGG